MSSGQSGPPGSHPIGNSGGSWSGPQESEMFTRELEALSTSQLEELLSDEDAFKRFAIRCIGNTPVSVGDTPVPRACSCLPASAALRPHQGVASTGHVCSTVRCGWR